MAQLRTVLALVLVALPGCYADHLRDAPEPRPRPPALDAGVIDVAVGRPDVPAAPDAGCSDCSCCTCGRPSEGILCPLVGLGVCCEPGGIEVDVTISSATLGDDCASEDHGIADEDCGFDGCGCVQTAVQLEVRATGTPPEATRIEVTDVRLRLDGELVADLSPRALLVWSAEASAYVPWDGTVRALDHLRARVETTAPDWATIGGGDPWRTYGMRFRIEVTYVALGEERTVSFEPVLREPEIAT